MSHAPNLVGWMLVITTQCWWRPDQYNKEMNNRAHIYGHVHIQFEVSQHTKGLAYELNILIYYSLDPFGHLKHFHGRSRHDEISVYLKVTTTIDIGPIWYCSTS
jgi:hypothetical protein